MQWFCSGFVRNRIKSVHRSSYSSMVWISAEKGTDNSGMLSLLLGSACTASRSFLFLTYSAHARAAPPVSRWCMQEAGRDTAGHVTPSDQRNILSHVKLCCTSRAMSRRREGICLDMAEYLRVDGK